VYAVIGRENVLTQPGLALLGVAVNDHHLLRRGGISQTRIETSTIDIGESLYTGRDSKDILKLHFHPTSLTSERGRREMSGVSSKVDEQF
jgi:hypothetical protein